MVKMKNSSFTTAVMMLFISFLAMVTVIFAWFTISDTGSTPSFVSTVGVFNTVYGFSKIVDGTPLAQDGFVAEKMIPGNKFTFALTVANDSEVDGLVSVTLYNITSGLVGPNQSISLDFGDNPQNKVQYAYSYRVVDVFWVPHVLVIEESIDLIDQDFYQYKTDQELLEKDWLKLNEIERRAFSFEKKYFNLLTEDLEDYLEYHLGDDLYLRPKSDQPIEGYVSTNKSVCLIFFEIAFNSSAMIPAAFAHLPIPDSNIYLNQRLQIDHVVITAKSIR